MAKTQAHNEPSSKHATAQWNWSLGGSFIASLCCVGPAVAALLGIGGASFLLGLTRYRIPLLLAGLAIAGIGTMQALRVSRRTCSPQEHRRNQWLVPSITLATFAITYGVLTYIFPTIVYRSIKPAAASAPAQPAQPEGASSSQTQTSPTLKSATPTAAPTPRDTSPAVSAPTEAQPTASPAPAVSLRRAALAISGMT